MPISCKRVRTHLIIRLCRRDQEKVGFTRDIQEGCNFKTSVMTVTGRLTVNRVPQEHLQEFGLGTNGRVYDDRTNGPEDDITWDERVTTRDG